MINLSYDKKIMFHDAMGQIELGRLSDQGGDKLMFVASPSITSVALEPNDIFLIGRIVKENR